MSDRSMQAPALEERLAVAPADLEGTVAAFTALARRLGRRAAERELRRILRAGVDEFVRRVLEAHAERTRTT